jgi:hypothetical protein
MKTPFGAWPQQVTILCSSGLSDTQNAVKKDNHILDVLAGAVSTLDGQVKCIQGRTIQKRRLMQSALARFLSQ